MFYIIETEPCAGLVLRGGLDGRSAVDQMATPKQRRLESAIAAIQGRYGQQALRQAGDLARQRIPPHLATGFSGLDALTGCAGLPLNASVLLSGQMTSGKLTVAYKTLAAAQTAGGRSPSVAILDLARTTNPDYLQRCGVAVARVLIARPAAGRLAVDLLLDLVRSRGVRAILVDSLAEIAAEAAVLRYLAANLGKLDRLLDGSGCLVLWIDEPEPAWRRFLNWDRGAALRQHAALHLAFQQEQWCQQAQGLAGYQAQVRLLKSRWAQAGATTTIRIVFNGTVRGQTTW
jgi:hypothetical protein